MNQDSNRQVDCDVVVVGAGFAGIYALWSARQRGLSVRGFESGSDVGGTWFWNAYPGARCDVSSYSYAYFFRDDVVRDWNWSEVCASQQEIQHYLRFVAQRCGILDLLTFDTRVLAVHYDADAGLWSVRTSGGETVVCRYVVLAIGALSNPKSPDIEGVDTFKGEAYFTSTWPREKTVDLSGKRVGVIGTGSSGVQVIPEVAKVAKAVYVFQRTANFVVPSDSGPMNSARVDALRRDPQAVRKSMRETFGGNLVSKMGEQRFNDLDRDGQDLALAQAWAGNYIGLAFRDAHLPEANARISEYIRARMQEQVADAWTAHHLVPWDHPFGGKRPCRSDAYLKTFNEPHVRLIALPETPIVRITRGGIETSAESIELDVLIYATGFDAVSGALFSIDIRGVNGATMQQAWVDGPNNYLGTMVHGFPNLFLPSSALSPSVLSNMAALAEQQIDFVFDSIQWLDEHGRPRLHPREESQSHWREETLRYAKRRPGALTTKSWYSGANIPGKPRVFMVYTGGFKRYDDICKAELRDGFPGYNIEPAA